MRCCQLLAHLVITLFSARFHGTKRIVVLSPANDRVGSVRLQTIHELFELSVSSRDQLRNCNKDRSSSNSVWSVSTIPRIRSRRGSSCAAPLISLYFLFLQEQKKDIIIIIIMATYPEAGSHSFAYHAKALNPLYPLSTLLSHTCIMSTACKIQGRFISVETEVLLA